MPAADIYLTGHDLVCPGGASRETLFDALMTGQSGIAPHEGYAVGKAVAIGKIDTEISLNEHAERICASLLAQSSLKDYSRTWLVVGSSVGGVPKSEKRYLATKDFGAIILKEHCIRSVAEGLQKRFGFKEAVSISTACTSSANAAVFAWELIKAGACESVMVVGLDALCLTTVNGFDALGVLSGKTCQPFDAERTGMNVSEGAACLLFQSTPQGAFPVRLAGVGSSSDAYSITHPHPEGTGALSAMRRAIECAKIAPEAIGYINAHGTGTIANDAAESAAIISLFGSRPFVHGSKAVTGHTLGAAGAIELSISAMVLEKKIVPGNFHLQKPLSDLLRLSTTSQPLQGRYALSNSFAFGGNNASLLLEAPL